MRSIDASMMELFARWAAGDVTADGFAHLFDAILFDGHVGSHIIGQEQSGLSAVKGVARLVGREKADEEAFFLRRFLADMIAGRYTDDEGEFDQDKALVRARLYQGKMRGTASQGFVDASPSDALFEWRLGAVEDHCPDCPELASISQSHPFRKDTMFQHPGDGSTPCLGNCKCHWVRISDGAQSQTAA
jgi:hypothetical protein